MYDTIRNVYKSVESAQLIQDSKTQEIMRAVYGPVKIRKTQQQKYHYKKDTTNMLNYGISQFKKYFEQLQTFEYYYFLDVFL